MFKSLRSVLPILLAVFCIPLLCFGCKSSENPVFDYFSKAEIQYEGKEQEDNIVQALKDILTLSESELREKRYSDYSGKPGQWDLQTLVLKHFVPDKPEKTLGKNFYRDVKAEEVQVEVKKLLERVE